MVDTLEPLAGAVPNVGNEDTQETPDFTIPDAYKDKPYLKDVKTNEDLFKKLDGAEQLIGKKVLFPDESSSEEDIKRFNIAAGMPEESKGYTFEGENRDESFDQMVKDIFHKYGISAKAGTGITKDVEAAMAEVAEKQNSEKDAEFNSIVKETFGERADEVLKNGNALLKENIPAKYADRFNEMSNEDLVLFAGVLDNIQKKYISEDRISSGGAPLAGETKDSLQQELTELMNNPAYKNGMHKDHEIIRKKISETVNKIANIEG